MRRLELVPVLYGAGDPGMSDRHAAAQESLYSNRLLQKETVNPKTGHTRPEYSQRHASRAKGPMFPAPRLSHVVLASALAIFVCLVSLSAVVLFAYPGSDRLQRMRARLTSHLRGGRQDENTGFAGEMTTTRAFAAVTASTAVGSTLAEATAAATSVAASTSATDAAATTAAATTASGMTHLTLVPIFCVP